MPDNTDANLNIGIAGGLTATISTDYVIDSYGTTSHVQLFKVVYGTTSDATRVTSSTPLPTYLASTGVTLNTRSTVVGGGTGGAVQIVNYSTSSLKVNGSGLNDAVITQDQAGNTLLTNIYTNTQAFVSNFGSGGYTIKTIGVGPTGATSGSYVRLFDPTTNLIAGVSNGGGSPALMVQVLGAPITLTANVNPSVGIFNSATGPIFIQGSTGSPVSITGVTLEALLTTINQSGNSGATFTSRIPAIETLLTAGTAKVTVENTTLPTSILTGLFSASTTATGIYPTGFTCKKGVNLKSKSDNTQFVFVGESGFTYGYPLDPGEGIFLEISNLNKIFAKSGGGSTGQNLYYLAR
jgi:hypothetical protein